MNTFKITWGDEISVAQLFASIAIETRDKKGKSMFYVNATTARELATELTRIADLIEEDE